MKAVPVVIGYVPRVDWIPVDARQLGLVHRVAFILPGRPGEDHPFDSPLYAALLRSLSRLFAPDAISFSRRYKGTLEDRGAAGFEAVLAQLTEEDGPLFSAIFSTASTVHAMVECQPWSNAGGPIPYGDDDAVSVYCERDRSEEIIAACDRGLREADAAVGRRIQGGAAPEEGLWLRRLWKRLSGSTPG